jgi:hypothetical protein
MDTDPTSSIGTEVEPPPEKDIVIDLYESDPSQDSDDEFDEE